jgi:transposase
MEKRIRRCDVARRQQWQAAIERWQSSGQSVRAFCRQEGLKESAFFFWRRELGRQDRTGAASPPVPPAALKARFLPVAVVTEDDSPAGSRIEIVFGSGRVVRVSPRFDRQTLADVLSVLEAGPC